MRVLVVSNFFPPRSIGGYELGCRDVVEQLRLRGHDVTVLTSSYGEGSDFVESGILRDLRWEPLGPGWMPRRIASKPRVFAHNYERTRRVLSELRPDAVHLWNPANISLAPAFAAEDAEVATAFFISDHWLANWERWPHPRLRALGQRALVRCFGARSVASLDLRHCHFVSRYIRDVTASSGRSAPDAETIAWGVDTAVFPFSARPREGTLRLLYAGQIAPHKGLHTVIQAVALLRDRYGIGAELTVAGGSVYPSYLQSLPRLLRAHRLEDHVRMIGSIARSELAAIYHAHDIFVFPSIWPEPFSLALLEAMSAGTPVVGTLTGGSGEVLEDGVTGLAFAAGDAGDCARAILRLAESCDLAAQLAAKARARVEQDFTLAGMMDRIESALARACSGKTPPIMPRGAGLASRHVV